MNYFVATLWAALGLMVGELVSGPYCPVSCFVECPAACQCAVTPTATIVIPSSGEFVKVLVAASVSTPGCCPGALPGCQTATCSYVPPRWDITVGTLNGNPLTFVATSSSGGTGPGNGTSKNWGQTFPAVGAPAVTQACGGSTDLVVEIVEKATATTPARIHFRETTVVACAACTTDPV